MKRLDPVQVSLGGQQLIEASAGTGKTHTITTLFVRILLELSLEVEQVLVVTYTRAATAELRDRVRRRIGQTRDALLGKGEIEESDPLAALVRERRLRGEAAVERDRAHLEQALRAFDQAPIFTIHAFCQRVLADHAFESDVGFDTELLADVVPMLEDLTHDFWIRALHAAPERFVRFLADKRVTPATLVGLARATAEAGHVPVLPEAITPADLEGAERAFETAREHAADAWNAGREVVLDLLGEEGVLKRGSYPTDDLRGAWAPELDAFFLGESAETPAMLDRLTPSILARRTRKNRQTPSHPFFDACADLLEASSALEGALEERLLSLRLELIAFGRRELQARKRAKGVQSYDDLLVQLHDALGGPAGGALAARVREEYPAALIDEFQDTDRIQYGIFRRVYGDSDGSLFLIGDPKQAIYAFRGADVFTYAKAAEDTAGRAHTLSVNWRSDPGVVGAVNSLFDRARSPFLFRAIHFAPVDPQPKARERLEGGAAGHASLEILFVPRVGPVDVHHRRIKTSGWAETALPGHVATEISRLLSSGATLEGEDGGRRPVGPGDLAVLCRTNKQARWMQTALRGLGIPGVFEGDSSVFDTEEALELERVLTALAHPGDASAVRAALATPLFGVTGDGLFALRTDEEAWDGWLARFGSWRAALEERGVLLALHRVFDEQAVQSRLLALADGERRLTNLLHLGELLHTAASRQHLGPLTLLRWLGQMRRDAGARSDLAAEDAQVRLESDARAVRLTTIHKSKGLEWPIVYCPFLWGKAYRRKAEHGGLPFHDPDDGQRLKIDLGSHDLEAHEGLADREALAEDLRLLYVALTRAKHRCTVLWGAFKGADRSALGYLLHQPPNAEEDPSQATASRLADLSDDAMRADLARLVEENRADGESGAPNVAVRDLSFAPGSVQDHHPETAATLEARIATRSLSGAFRSSSFSGLSAGHASTPAGGGSDADQEPEVTVERDHDERATELAVRAPRTGAPAKRVTLHDFPAGARPGQLVHEIFEHLDFAQASNEAVREQVEVTLKRYGVDPGYAEALYRAVQEVLSTPLPSSGEVPLHLGSVTADRRLTEMEFVFPVAPRDGGLLTPGRLAEVFARAGAPAAAPAYAERLRCLDFPPLEGWMRGFVDLIFEHDGRWYVLDYKSNHLGPTAQSYGQAPLRSAMAEHHYFLQYHLYVVALARYLAQRVPGWDYDTGFGGVHYLFLRGMAPHHPEGTGVYFDRPPRALIEELSRLMSPPPTGGIA